MRIPKNFIGYAGDPELESEVVFLFGLLYDYVVKAMGIPFATTKVRGAFPDCLGINQGKGKAVRIEFEVLSSNFISHGHPMDSCEYIVCWVDDWPSSFIAASEKPLKKPKIISLKSIIEKTGRLKTRFLNVPRPDSPHVHETYQPQHDSLLFYIPDLGNVQRAYFIQLASYDIQKRCCYVNP